MASVARPSHYLIIDRHTGETVGKARTLSRALQSVDRRDTAYGACRFYHEAVWTFIPLDDAFTALQARGIAADYEGADLFDCRTGENIARIRAGQVALEAIDACAA